MTEQRLHDRLERLADMCAVSLKTHRQVYDDVKQKIEGNRALGLSWARHRDRLIALSQLFAGAAQDMRRGEPVSATVQDWAARDIGWRVLGWSGYLESDLQNATDKRETTMMHAMKFTAGRRRPKPDHAVPHLSGASIDGSPDPAEHQATAAAGAPRPAAMTSRELHRLRDEADRQWRTDASIRARFQDLPTYTAWLVNAVQRAQAQQRRA